MSYNGKSGNSHLLLCNCKYFDKSFTEMVLELSSNNHRKFVDVIGLISCYSNRKPYFFWESIAVIQVSVVTHGSLVQVLVLTTEQTGQHTQYII